MATKISEIKKILEANGLEVGGDGKNLLVVTYQDKESVVVKRIITANIREEENGEFITIQSNVYDTNEEYLKILPSRKYYMEVVNYLMGENYKNKIGSWGLDERDGSLRFSTNIALENAILVHKQLFRVMRVISGQAIETIKEIKSILETGKKRFTNKEKIEKSERKIKNLREIAGLACGLLKDKKNDCAKKMLSLALEEKFEEARKVKDEIFC